jgi:hypothetical protein
MPHDKNGTAFDFNAYVTFYHEKDGVVYGKVISFTENGDIFVDKLVKKGKGWDHRIYQVNSHSATLVMKTKGTQGN